jgi:hypothetical protein
MHRPDAEAHKTLRNVPGLIRFAHLSMLMNTDVTYRFDDDKVFMRAHVQRGSSMASSLHVFVYVYMFTCTCMCLYVHTTMHTHRCAYLCKRMYKNHTYVHNRKLTNKTKIHQQSPTLCSFPRNTRAIHLLQLAQTQS